MPHSTLLTLLVIAALVWFWLDGLRAREQALKECRRACRQAGVQLLDETVALSALRLVPEAGRLALERRFGFEFSLNGDARHGGRIILRGRRIVSVQLEHPDGLVIM